MLYIAQLLSRFDRHTNSLDCLSLRGFGFNGGNGNSLAGILFFFNGGD